MRKFLATLLALVMTLALMVPASWGENKETYQLPDSLEGKTVILHTNDVHGAIDKYAKVAALRDECYDKGAHQVILLDAGDFSQGSPYVSLSKGATALDMMALVGYDVITLGNHEFDYGFPQLMENLKKHQGDFMVACNNLVDDEGELIFAPGGTAPIYADDTYETELFRIAIVGMATPETQTKANPALMKGLSFIGGKDLYKVTQENVDMARSEGNADIVIALGHLGVDKSSEPNCSYNVMQNVKGIDLFIDGHSHTVMTASKDNSMVQSTGTGLAYVGAIIIDNATKSIESNGLIDLSAYTKEDATVKAAADKIISDINAEYGKVFARTDVELNGDKDPGNRTQETNLGDLITDSMLWAIRKDAELTVPAENVVAITNGGGIRAWIHKGDISKLDVNTVLPFGNTVAVVYVTGAELLEALEASTFALPDSLGGFPQIAGMNISIDATKKYDPQTTPYPSGSGKATYYGPASINRVTINSVNGKAFDPPSGVLLLQSEAAVVRGHGLDLALAQGRPKGLLVPLLPDGRGADIPGGHGILRRVIHAVLQHQILGAGLHIHPLAPLAGGLYLPQGGLVGQMHDDHRDVHRLGDAQEPGHGLGLQEIGPGPGMGAHAHLARRLLFGDQRVDDAAVFAVHAADAALFLQLLQGVIHGLVADHHGGIGHIHLEGGDTGGVHIVDLRLDAGIPVVDGHMEAVVTAAVAVGLLVPQLQPLVQGFALVGAGEVHHRGGAAPQSRPAAGEKVVHRGGAAHVQVEVGVGVDEARQQKLPLHVDDGGLRRGDAAGHPENLLVLHQHVRPAGAPSGHHCAPAKQIFHGKCPPFPG